MEVNTFLLLSKHNKPTAINQKKLEYILSLMLYVHAAYQG